MLLKVNRCVGRSVGCGVGRVESVGRCVGGIDGSAVGSDVGVVDGSAVGSDVVGSAVGSEVDGRGESVGRGVETRQLYPLTPQV